MITYIATNTLNGKFYIGSTTDFDKRKYNHLAKKVNYPFQCALRKNPELFTWETHEDDDDDPVLEQALLDMYYGTEQCYNLNPVAGRPPRCKGHSEATIKKMVESHSTPECIQRVKESNAKRCEDPEYVKRHREATIRGSNTAEARLKNSERRKENWKDPAYREKMSEAHRGKGLPWWVNETGTTTRSEKSPGPEWKSGRKWKP
jgi:group I intron endonuclease